LDSVSVVRSVEEWDFVKAAALVSKMVQSWAHVLVLKSAFESGEVSAFESASRSAPTADAEWVPVSALSLVAASVVHSVMG
jgi:hypothetical protein